MQKKAVPAETDSDLESDEVFELAAEVFRIMSAPMRLKIISALCNGEKNVGELLAEGLAGNADGPAHEQLSERELQVFLRLAKGETVGHIAGNMALSVKTVSTYRSRVLEKLKLASNSDLTYSALKNGLIQ